MGNNTVAVLYNDMTHEIKEAMPRLGYAMSEWNTVTGPVHFGPGKVISRDHSSGYQAVIIGGNTGWAAHEIHSAPEEAIRALCRAIDRTGWTKVRGKWRAPLAKAEA